MEDRARLLSIVVPVYNNAPTLEETCRQIKEVHQAAFALINLEIVFVNDGSKDVSWDELLRLKSLHSEITLVNLARNFGQFGALFAGFNSASGDAVICISADLQDSVGLMAKMVALWKEGTEIVVCYREARHDGFLTTLFSGIAYTVARQTYPEIPQGGFDYWLMSKRVSNLLCSFKGRHNFIQGYLLSIGYSKAFIPYTRAKRPFDKSGYSFGKKLKILIDFVVDTSYLPVRIMSAVGVISALSGVVYSLMIALAWFAHKTPFSGWAPLMVINLVMGGMIMVMLGVIGEYIWRIYDNLRDFPSFIIADVMPFDQGET